MKLTGASHWRWVGMGLSLVGVVYLAMRLRGQADQLLAANTSAMAWGMTGLLALLYGGANVLLARAWLEMLCHQCAIVRWPEAFRIYGVSQLGKYVPGNLFHLLGRQALGSAQGIPGRALAVSAVWEMAFLAVGASLFAAWLIQLVWPIWRSELGAVLFFTCAVAVAAAISHFGSRPLGRAFFWHIAFLGATGVMFSLVFVVMSEEPVPWRDVPVLGAAYVLAWLAGLLTPGAPAGLGVREAAVLLLLEGTFFSPALLLLAVLVMRCVTVVGDLVFFALACRQRAADRTVTD